MGATPYGAGHWQPPLGARSMQAGGTNAHTASELLSVVTSLLLQHEQVDGKAAQALMDAPLAQQLQVWQQGSLQGSKNPSSALLGRLKRAQGAQPMRSSPY